MPDDNSKADMSYSGYLLYKGMNRDLLNQGNNPKSKYRAGMLFRLADFYLLYAEALNHVNPVMHASFSMWTVFVIEPVFLY